MSLINLYAKCRVHFKAFELFPGESRQFPLPGAAKLDRTNCALPRKLSTLLEEISGVALTGSAARRKRRGASRSDRARRVNLNLPPLFYSELNDVSHLTRCPTVEHRS